MKFDRDSLLLVAPAIYLLVLPIPHTTALRNIVFGISVLLLLATWRSWPVPSIPLRVPFAAWFALAVVSLIGAVNLRYSVGEIRSEIVYGVLTFLIFYRTTRSEKDLSAWFLILAASAALISVLGFIHFYRGEDPYHVGSYGGTLHFAAYLNTVFPVFIVMALTAAGKRRALVLLIIAMLLLTAYGSTSRAVWIALVVEFAVFGGLYLARMAVKPNVRRMIVTSGLAAAVAFSGALLYVTKEKLQEVHKLSASGPVEIVTQAIKADRRPKLWMDTFEFIKERPLTGAGFGRMVLGPQIVAQQNDPNHSHAHNVFLNYALQLGVLGPFVILFVFGAVAKEGFRASRDTGLTLRLLGIALVAMVAGTFVQCMIEDVFVEHMALVFWALTGITLGCARNRATTQENPTLKPAGSVGLVSKRLPCGTRP